LIISLLPRRDAKGEEIIISSLFMKSRFKACYFPSLDLKLQKINHALNAKRDAIILEFSVFQSDIKRSDFISKT